MSMTETMKGMGRTARNKAGAMGHQMKDRALEKRLERAADEADRLRFENELLRDEVAESHSEHQRILDLLETRLQRDVDTTDEPKSHKGRWLLFLLAIGGAVAWVRTRMSGGSDDWGTTSMPDDSGTGTSSV